jgi:hypothetical protein
MTVTGYTMMCEQAGPKQLVRDVALAEEVGFDFAVSDPLLPMAGSCPGRRAVAVQQSGELPGRHSL